MIISKKEDNLDFFSGGGEMGKLTREKDWTKTSLGSPVTWHYSLRTSLSILLNSKFPMFLFWGSELLCFYNDAYRPSLGKDGKHPDILGMPGKEAWPEIWDIIKPLIDQVMRGGGAVWFEDLLVPIYRNGKIEDVFWTFSYSPVHDDSGNIAGVLVICMETTDKLAMRKELDESNKKGAQELKTLVEQRTRELTQLNESLKKSEMRYHLMVEEVQDYAILYLNREGIVENWNAGAEKIKGYKAEEIIGKSFSNFYTEADRKNHLPRTLLKQAVLTGRAGQEGWRVRKDGSLFWASVTITAVHNKEHEVIGFSKVTHDLTEKKNADDRLQKNASELEEKNRELERINKELESFAYISSHDLQEPLRKIQTFSSRILEREYNALSENGKENFKRMQNAAERMQTLINDLLTYSRTNPSEKKFEKTPLDKIINDVKEDLKEDLKEKQATIEATDLCELNIIPFQFRQMMNNLIGNALKFSNPVHPPHISIKSEIVSGSKLNNEKLLHDHNYCHIRVADNGIGFEPHYSEKIFEVFQRLHDKSEYNGTGIGLAIVKKIVENHNGIITATAELNNGATFDIYIPAE